MFIKRDLRKVPEILADPDDKRECLKLGRRYVHLASNRQHGRPLMLLMLLLMRQRG